MGWLTFFSNNAVTTLAFLSVVVEDGFGVGAFFLGADASNGAIGTTPASTRPRLSLVVASGPPRKMKEQS